jgi:hypothetical protein
VKTCLSRSRIPRTNAEYRYLIWIKPRKTDNTVCIATNPNSIAISPVRRCILSGIWFSIGKIDGRRTKEGALRNMVHRIYISHTRAKWSCGYTVSKQRMTSISRIGRKLPIGVQPGILPFSNILEWQNVLTAGRVWKVMRRSNAEYLLERSRRVRNSGWWPLSWIYQHWLCNGALQQSKVGYAVTSWLCVGVVWDRYMNYFQLD